MAQNGKHRNGKKMIGIFAYLDDLTGAIRAAREKGFSIERVYSPTRNHELDEALGARPSSVRFFALGGALLGIFSGFALSIFTVLQWKFIVQGRAVVPIPPFIVVAFELCILLGVFGNLFGVIVNTRLPHFRIPSFYDARFSGDRFGLVVKCRLYQTDDLAELLTANGAEEVHEA